MNARLLRPIRERAFNLVASSVLAFALAAAVGFAPTAAWADPSTSFDVQVQPTGTLSSGRSSFLWSYGADGAVPLANDALPTRYDLREQGLSTTMKNQYYLNSCWAFGTLGSLESNLLVQGNRSTGSLAAASSEATLPDLSERHLGWFALEAQHDGNQKGEGVTVTVGTENPDWGPIYHITAAEAGQAIAALAAWEGAVDETTAPYQNNEGTLDPTKSWDVDEGLRFSSNAHLTDAECLPQPVTEADDGTYAYSPASVQAVKQALYDEGAVSVSYYADASSPGQGPDPEYINYDTWATCVAQVNEGVEHPEGNHTVTIVGWDDAYARDNFNAKHLPEGDGAWIVKNSWGTDWGIENTGYFYLSYYDESASEFYRFSGDDGSDGFDYAHNYQYDYQGVGCSLTQPTTTATKRSTASVFTVEGTQTGAESLDAVSAVTMAPHATVNARVYKLRDDATGPTDGVLVAQASETYANTGYHTLELGSEAVTFSAGQRFSVVETVTTEAADGSARYHTAFEGAPADDAASQAACGERSGQPGRELAVHRRRRLGRRRQLGDDSVERRAGHPGENRQRAHQGLHERCRTRRFRSRIGCVVRPARRGLGDAGA